MKNERTKENVYSHLNKGGASKFPALTLKLRNEINTKPYILFTMRPKIINTRDE